MQNHLFLVVKIYFSGDNQNLFFSETSIPKGSRYGGVEVGLTKYRNKCCLSMRVLPSGVGGGGGVYDSVTVDFLPAPNIKGL